MSGFGTLQGHEVCRDHVGISGDPQVWSTCWTVSNEHLAGAAGENHGVGKGIQAGVLGGQRGHTNAWGIHKCACTFTIEAGCNITPERVWMLLKTVPCSLVPEQLYHLGVSGVPV